MEIQGRVIEIQEPETLMSKAGKEYTKGGIVIETEDEYPKQCFFTLFGNVAQQLDFVSMGDVVSVGFYPESRQYNGRWYTDNKARSIETITKAQVPDVVSQVNTSPDKKEMGDESDDDSLPF